MKRASPPQGPRRKRHNEWSISTTSWRCMFHYVEQLHQSRETSISTTRSDSTESLLKVRHQLSVGSALCRDQAEGNHTRSTSAEEERSNFFTVPRSRRLCRGHKVPAHGPAQTGSLEAHGLAHTASHRAELIGHRPELRHAYFNHAPNSAVRKVWVRSKYGHHYICLQMVRMTTLLEWGA